MLTVVDDTTLVQHLVNYKKMEDGHLDMDNIDFKRVYGDDLLPSFAKCGGTSTTWYSYQETYSYNCGGDTGSGAHGPGDDRCTADPDDRGGYGTVTRWASITVNEPECIDAGTSTGGGGGSSGGGDGGTITVPMDPNEPQEPCTSTSISDGNGGCIEPGDGSQDPSLLDPNIERVKETIHNEKFKISIKNLELSLDREFETGYSFDLVNESVSPTPYRSNVEVNRFAIYMPILETTIGTAHTHFKKFIH